MLVRCALFVALVCLCRSSAPTTPTQPSPPPQPPPQPEEEPEEQPWKINSGCPFAPWRAFNFTDAVTRDSKRRDKYQFLEDFDNAKLAHTCYGCRWCPHKEPACCEEDDEIALLQGIRVNGDAYWDCFISIMKFQECGKCSSDAWRFTSNEEDGHIPRYIYTPKRITTHFPRLHVRLCKSACLKIWEQCHDVPLLGVEGVAIPYTATEYCGGLPEAGNCYDGAFVTKVSVVTPLVVLLAIALLLAL